MTHVGLLLPSAILLCFLFQALVPVHRDVSVPFEYHRLIIGSNGSYVRSMKRDLQVVLSVPPPEMQSDVVEVTGLSDNVEQATQALLERVQQLRADEEDRVTTVFMVSTGCCLFSQRQHLLILLCRSVASLGRCSVSSWKVIYLVHEKMLNWLIGRRLMASLEGVQLPHGKVFSCFMGRHLVVSWQGICLYNGKVFGYLMGICLVASLEGVQLPHGKALGQPKFYVDGCNLVGEHGCSPALGVVVIFRETVLQFNLPLVVVCWCFLLFLFNKQLHRRFR